VTDPRTAALVVTLIGLHPAAAECVGWFACQPILFAALASLMAVDALLRLRQKLLPQRIDNTYGGQTLAPWLLAAPPPPTRLGPALQGDPRSGQSQK
jgi:hypothetical protein